jgi:hypothetical protein
MDDDARRLVDDEEVLVRVDDGELRRRNRGLGGSSDGQLELDLLPARQLVALASGLPVEEDEARPEEPLGRRARADLRQRCEVAVEPLSRGLERDDALQRLGAGSRSARRSAPSRITTPITMKLSARLNAGQ